MLPVRQERRWRWLGPRCSGWRMAGARHTEGSTSSPGQERCCRRDVQLPADGPGWEWILAATFLSRQVNLSSQLLISYNTSRQSNKTFWCNVTFRGYQVGSSKAARWIAEWYDSYNFYFIRVTDRLIWRGITTTSGHKRYNYWWTWHLQWQDSPPAPTLKNEEKLSVRDGREQMRPIYHKMLRPTTTRGHTPSPSSGPGQGKIVLLGIQTESRFNNDLRQLSSFRTSFRKMNRSIPWNNKGYAYVCSQVSQTILSQHQLRQSCAGLLYPNSWSSKIQFLTFRPWDCFTTCSASNL